MACLIISGHAIVRIGGFNYTWLIFNIIITNITILTELYYNIID